MVNINLKTRGADEMGECGVWVSACADTFAHQTLNMSLAMLMMLA